MQGYIWDKFDVVLRSKKICICAIVDSFVMISPCLASKTRCNRDHQEVDAPVDNIGCSVTPGADSRRLDLGCIQPRYEALCITEDGKIHE